MPGTARINREQRDGIYELVRNHLAGIGDVAVALEENEDIATAERLAIEFGEDFRLLDDLGWRPDEERDAFELTMPPHDLMELLGRLQGDAARLLEGSPTGRRSREEDEATNDQIRVGLAACTRLQADLDPRKREQSPSASNLDVEEGEGERPATLTIGANERNVLHRLMLHRLFVLGDRPDELAEKEGISLLELSGTFREDLELMADLGWLSGSDIGQGVDLHMPSGSLIKTLKRLREDARRASLELRLELDSTETAGERQEWFQFAIRTCDRLVGMAGGRS